MGLVSEYVKVRVNGNNAKYYESLGYFIPRKGNGKLDFSQYLTIKVHDLLHGSNVRVDVVCDRCLKPYDISYGHYYNHNHTLMLAQLFSSLIFKSTLFKNSKFSTF